MRVLINREKTGKRISKLMREHKMTACDVAEAVGNITEKGIYKWTAGAVLPNLEQLLILSYLFDCDIIDIVVATMKESEP